MVVVGVVGVAWLALVGAWIAAIVSIARFSRAAFGVVGRSRGATLALVVVTGWLGALYYWIAIKPSVEPHRDAPEPSANLLSRASGPPPTVRATFARDPNQSRNR